MQTQNISKVRKMDNWTKEDLSFPSFHEFLKANSIVANSTSQYNFWQRSWNFYKKLA